MSGLRYAARGVMLLVAIVALLAVPSSAHAGNDGVVPQHTKPNPNLYREAGIDEKIGDTVPMDVTLRDEKDQEITLGDAIDGKATIFVPVYYRCPMLCTKVLTGVLEACRKMPQSFSIGTQFNVVTVSMDPLEHGDLARAKKKAYVDEYGRAGGEKGWRFLTGKKENINKLLDSVGYRFEFDKMLKEYNHPSAIIILSPKGKITRYFYGIGYDGEFQLPKESETWNAANPKPKLTESEQRERKEGREFTRPTTTLRLSLIEASEGNGGSIFDKMTLLCYRYDALHQGYSLNVIWAVRIGGIITLLLVGCGVVLAFRREGMLGALLSKAATFALICVWIFGMFTTLMLYNAMSRVLFTVLFTVGILIGAGGLLLLFRRKALHPTTPEPSNGTIPVSPTGGTA